MVDDVFLGMELAVARVSEELHRATASGPSPLRGVAYPRGADLLWKWVDAQEDAEVWTFVRAYTGVDDHARVRAGLTMDDFHTLLTFARRCVLAALRNEDPGAAEAAFDALSAIDVERVDGSDVVVVASLASFAARRVGLEPDEVRGRAVRWADPQVAKILERAVGREVDLAAWGYREMLTLDGPVLVDSLGGPSPDADDLLERAAKVVELVNDDGIYEVNSTDVVGEVPTVWLGGDTPQVREALRGLRSCAKVHAEPPGIMFRDFLLIFLVETAEERHAETIAAAAHRTRDTAVQTGVAVGRRCAVVIASSAVVGEPSVEDVTSLNRFREPIAALLS
ncbi:hypothetical protein [Actinophytocola sp.]|uniref:hypothetical protein n=1 Tax=Actinophytocola sp. TaxID=1872138 RepID=UPI002ED491A3